MHLNHVHMHLFM